MDALIIQWGMTMRIDDSLKIAAQIMSAQIQTTPMVLSDVPDELHRLHRHIMHMQAGTYRPKWQDEVPFAVELEGEIRSPSPPLPPKSYAPPTNPLADPDVSVDDKVAGTVFHDRIECLECGCGVKLLKSHLLTSHNRMTWEEYIDRHGLPADYPATTEAHKARQRDGAVISRAERRIKALGLNDTADTAQPEEA